MSEITNKSEKIDEFFDVVLSLYALKGPDQVTVTNISRKLGVSRAWIYKYFGKSKDDWISNAAFHISALISKLNVKRGLPKSKDEILADFRQDSETLLQEIEKRPWIGILFFRFLGNSNHPIGKAINDAESEYSRKTGSRLSAAFDLSENDAHALALALGSQRMAMAYQWSQGVVAKSGVDREQWIQLMLPSINVQTWFSV